MSFLAPGFESSSGLSPYERDVEGATSLIPLVDLTPQLDYLAYHPEDGEADPYSSPSDESDEAQRPLLEWSETSGLGASTASYSLPINSQVLNQSVPGVHGNHHPPSSLPHPQHVNNRKTGSVGQNGDSVNIPIPVGSFTVSSSRDQPKRYPQEIKKTLVALLFTSFNFFLTCVSLAFVHENRPLIPPLPDQLLDRLHYQEWALYGSEILISVQMVIVGVVIFFHKHRFIVLRRVLLIVGCLYLYRAITMWVTVLPAPDPNYKCAPKFGAALTSRELFKRVFTIMTGFGLSINGNHIYCGDYIYSGHTMTIIIGHLVIQEYTRKKSLSLLRWVTWFNAIIAVILLVLSRGHYSVDVILAYFFATRLWAMYHTLCGHLMLRQSSEGNHFSTFWWFQSFRWFEGNVKAGKLPNEFNIPWILRLGLAKFRRIEPSPGLRRRRRRSRANSNSSHAFPSP